MSGFINSDSFAQVAPDSTGKQIRNLVVSTLGPTGSLQTTYQQVVTIADEFGGVIDSFYDQDYQLAVLDELRAIRLGIQLLLESKPQADEGQIDLLAEAQALREELSLREAKE